MASAKEFNCMCTVQYRRRDNKVNTCVLFCWYIYNYDEETNKKTCTLKQLEKEAQHGETYTTGHKEALPTSNSSLDFIWRAGLMVSKPRKQSTGTLVPHTLMDSSFRHLFTRTRRPLSVTWRQLHRTIVWKEH